MLRGKSIAVHTGSDDTIGECSACRHFVVSWVLILAVGHVKLKLCAESVPENSCSQSWLSICTAEIHRSTVCGELNFGWRKRSSADRITRSGDGDLEEHLEILLHEWKKLTCENITVESMPSRRLQRDTPKKAHSDDDARSTQIRIFYSTEFESSPTAPERLYSGTYVVKQQYVNSTVMISAWIATIGGWWSGLCCTVQPLVLTVPTEQLDSSCKTVVCTFIVWNRVWCVLSLQISTNSKIWDDVILTIVLQWKPIALRLLKICWWDWSEVETDAVSEFTSYTDCVVRDQITSENSDAPIHGDWMLLVVKSMYASQYDQLSNFRNCQLCSLRLLNLRIPVIQLSVTPCQIRWHKLMHTNEFSDPWNCILSPYVAIILPDDPVV